MLVPSGNLADELLLVNDRCGYESNAQDRRSNVRVAVRAIIDGAREREPAVTLSLHEHDPETKCSQSYEQYAGHPSGECLNRYRSQNRWHLRVVEPFPYTLDSLWPSEMNDSEQECRAAKESNQHRVPR